MSADLPMAPLVPPTVEPTTAPAAVHFLAPRELVVLDGTLPDADTLRDAIAADRPDADLLLLDPSRDALDQIGERLANGAPVSAIHLVAHGQAGQFVIRGAVIDASELARRTAQLQTWNLADHADILLYGCNVADGANGEAFVRMLAELTGADVAASTDLTGSEDRGGDWTLEFVTGEIDTATIAGPRLKGRWHGTLEATPVPSGTAGSVPPSFSTPLAFERNAGQTDATVDFLARGSGYTVFLDDGNAVIDVRQDDSTGHVVRLSLEGARAPVASAGGNLLSGTSHYLVGDVSDWHRDVEHYGSVRFDGVYDGIDVQYYGADRRLEYDFLVDAGIDTDVIGLRIEGAAAVEIADSGELVLTLDATGRTMTFQAPVSYQRTADGTREHVDSRYVLRADGTVGFELGNYDRTRELVIDPILGYATYLGGTGLETIEGIETDASGNVYVTGRTGSAAFPTSVGAYDTALSGSTDAFVTKFNSAGVLQYSTYFGGTSDEWAYNLTVDGSGQVVVVGETTSSDLAIVNGADSSHGGSSDGFVVKLNAAGSAILYSTYYGGANADYLGAVHLGSGNTVYVAGGTTAATWDGYAGAIDTGASGAGSLTWSQTYAAAGTEKLYDMDVDSTGDIWLIGETSTSSLTTGGPYDSTFNGGADVFLVRMSAAGGVEYVTYYGGTGNDYGDAIVVAADNTLYITGVSYSTTGIASTGAYDTTGDGTNGNAFLVHLDPSQTGSAQRLFGTYYGTSGASAAYEIAIDAEGRVVIVGQTSGTIPTTTTARDTTLSGTSDGFVAIFAADGSALRYGSYLGGDGTEIASATAVDTSGRLYVAGQTASTTLHTTGAYDTTGDATNGDGFIAQFLPLGSAARTATDGGLSINTDGGNDAYLVAADGGAVLGGRTALTLEFDFAIGTNASNDNTLLSYAVAGQANEVTVNVKSTGVIELDLEFVTRATVAAYPQLLDGNRHQIAITWDRATGDGAFYVDGVLAESFTGFKAGTTIDSGGTLVIGQEQDSLGAGFSTSQMFSGTLYDARIFSAVRTATEIDSARATTLPHDTPNLVANWRFGDWHTNGTTTDAVSGNALTLGHASGTGFTPSQPTLNLGIAERPDTGTVVGSITALSDDRQARIDALLAADATLTYNAQTDKFYKLGTSYVTWASALSTATATTLNGVTGQLVTVRSAAENAAVSSITGGNAVWLGAADAAVEGTWRWYDGSTPADQFWQGNASGYRIDGAYTNWNAGEPSDSGGEDRLYQQADGTWNDAPDGMTSWTLIEWDADEVLDAGQAITYSITTQTVSGAFTIDSDSGVLSVADGSLLDYDTQASHSVTVRVTEGALTYDRTYTIALSNLTLEADASAPASAATAEDTARTFSGAGGNAVTVSDGTASDTRMQVSLSVSQGVLTLSQTTGLTVVSGSNASSSMVLDGTESALNAALDGMTYTPSANYAGSDTLSVTIAVSADLAARYTFDAGTVTDTAAGTAQDGSLVGDATTTTDATRGTVLSLDGSGDSAQIASVYGSPANATIGGWVNLRATSSRAEFISLDDRIHIALDETGLGVKGSIQTGAATWDDLASGRYLAGDGWHHVMFVVDDTNNVNTLYIDGLAVASETVTTSVYWTGATTTHLGQHPGGSAYFNGLMDDVRIYTRALSAAEVATLAEEAPETDTASVALTVTAVNDTPENLYFIPGLAESSLIGVYTFSAQTDLGRDDAGQDAPITLYGSPTQTAGPSGGGALDLAGGSSGQYGDIAGITTGGAMTIAGDVRFDSLAVWQRIVDFGQANSSGITAIYVGRYGTTSDLTFTLEKDLGGGNWSVSRATATGAIVNGTWMHFAATVDGSGAMALYVNGVLADTEAGVVPEVGIRTHNYVGRSNWASDALFDGAIDDLVVANGALSATQVAALYQQSNAITIADNAADGTVLGTIVVADPDSPDTPSFTLPDSSSGRFAVAADGTLTVGTGSLLEYTSATSHTFTARATDSGSVTRDESFTVTLTAVNEAPSFASLDGTPTHVEGGAVVVLDADAQITDPELSAANDFSGATLTLARNGGADSDDALAFDGTNVTTVAENVFVGGVEIGDYVFTGGEMVVTFGANATQARVNTLLRNIVYWNWSDTPPASVQIDWTFDDGNTGAQGSGGALTASGSTTVSITATNDPPVNTIIGTLTGYGPASSALGDQSYELKSDQPWGQSFSHVSGNGTYTVDDVQLVLYRAADAPAGLTLTVSLRNSWTGAVIASGTLSSDTLSTAESWVDVVLSGPAVLTDGQTYVLRVDASAGAEKLYVGVDDSGAFTSGSLLDKDGTDQSGKDLAFLLDAPLWTYRDGTLVLASGGAGALSVADPDASTLQVTLSVQDGVVTLAQTTGLTFSAGDGSGDTVTTFTGTVAAINAALDGLVFEPDSGFSGIASISMTTSDLGGTGTGGTLTDTDIQYIVVDGVNGAPVPVADTATALEAGGTANGTAGTNPSGNVLTNDTDPDTGDAKTVIGVVAGVAGSASGSVGSLVTGTHGAITIAADGSFTYTVDNDDADVQALRTVADTLTDTFTYTLQDGGGLTATTQITVTIQGADDAPDVTLGAATGATPAGSETRANTTTANAQQPAQSRAVAADADANFVVVWSGNGTGDTAGVFGQRFSADGAALGGEFRVNTTTSGTQTNPTVAMTAGGAFVVAWNGNGPGDSGGIFGQRYDATGATVGSEFRINTTSNPSEEAYPAVSINDGGAFVVAWQDTFWDNVYAQRYDASGVAQGSEILVGSGEGSPFTPGVDVGIDANGGFVVAWASFGSGADSEGVYVRRYDATGTALAAMQLVNQTTDWAQTDPSLAVRADGSFIVAWTSMWQDPGTDDGVYARLYDASGTAEGNEFRVAATTTGTQWQPAVAAQAGGGFAVAWTSDAAGNQNVQLRLFDADGVATALGETTVNTVTTGAQSRPSLAVGGGRLIAAWNSAGQDGSGAGVYLQRLTVTAPEDHTATFTEGAGPVAIASGDATVADVDSATLQSMTVTITNRQDGTSETLGFDTSGTSIAGSYDSGTGILSLTGSASAADYQRVLRTVTYDNGAAAPGTTPRVIQVTADDGTGSGNVAVSTVSVSLVNDTPAFSGLDGTPAFTEGGTAVVLDGNVTVADTELSAANNFSGATLTLARNGGANAQDLFSATGTLGALTQGGNLVVGGTTIGTVTTNGAGSLVLTFNSSATNALVDSAMQQIAYSNSSDTPPGSVQIDWTFSDGNAGAQGSGGALTASGSTTVSLTAVNDAPSGADATILATEDTTYTFLVSDFGFSDADGNGLQRVWIDTLPGSGSLLWNGSTFAAGNWIDASDIAAGQLTYAPVADASGTAVASFTFRVQDDGGTANGGSNVDPAANTLTIDVSAVNDAPTRIVFDAGGGGSTALNTTTTGDQSQPAIAALPGGGWVAVWTSVGQDGDGGGIYAQRFNANGVAVGAEFRVNAGATYSQYAPSIATFSDGAFVVGWTEMQSGFAAWSEARVFAADGSALTGDLSISVPLSNPNEGYAAQVQVLGANRWAVVWSNESNGITLSIEGRIFDRAGVAQTAQFTVGPSGSAPDSWAVAPRATGLADGGMAVTWNHYDTSSQTTNRVQFVNADGTLRGAFTALSGTGLGDITQLADGRVVALSTNGGTIYATIFDSAGTVTVADYVVTTSHTAASSPQVTASGDGFVVAWTALADDGVTQEIVTQRFGASGTPVGVATRARPSADGAVGDIALATLADGSALLGWRADGLDGSGSGVYAGALQAAVREGAASGTVVASAIDVLDPDSADTHTFSLFDDAGGRFTIDGVSGRITVAGSGLLDYETATAHAIVVRATDGSSQSVDRSLTIQVLPVNEAPVFSNLDGTPAFTENGSPVVLDADVTVGDAELTGANNFSGATLTLARNGGANAQDLFSATGTLGVLTQGGNLVVGGTTIGTVTTNSAGSLVLTFNSSATNALVDSAMQQIAYSNSSDTPPGSVQIDWTFSDGNAGAQGSGGALTASGSTTVSLTAVNDAPSGAVVALGNTAVGETLVADTSGLSDADGLGAFAYQWLRNGTPIAGATGSSHTLVSGDVGSGISVRVSYTDGQGTQEQITSGVVGPVTLSLTPPVNTVPATATPVEDTPFAFTGADTISIADLDGNLTTVSASVGFGSLALTLSGGATLSAGALNSAAFTLSGSLAALNASLASLTYTPDADFDGTDTLTLVSTDATALADTDAVTLTVSPVDDAPVLTGLTLLVSQGSSTTLSTADFSISDPDGPGGPRAVDVRNVTEGVFELVTTPGVPVTSFAFADVAAGLVRFVHSGAGTAPSFEASVRDSLAPGTFVPAAVGFTPTPVVTTPGPSPEEAYSIVLTPTTPPSETPLETPGPVRPADPVTTGTAPQSGEATQGVGGRGERGPGAIDPRILMQMAVPRTPAPGAGDPAGSNEAGRGTAAPAPSAIGAGVSVSAPTAAPVASSGLPAGAQVPTAEAVTPDEPHSAWNAPAPLTVTLPGDGPASGPENRSAEEQQFDIMVNGVRLTGVSLSVGVVTWALRAGGIVSSLLASLPAWRFVDPLPILERAERARVVWRDDEDDDGEGDDIAKRDRAVEDLFGRPS